MSKKDRFYEIDFTDGSNVETLRYQIVNSPIADAWWNIVEGALSASNCHVSDNQWIQKAPSDTIDLLWGRMKTLVDELNTGHYEKMPQLVMPAEFELNVNYSELLNYLHLQFHKFTDNSEQKTAYTPLSELNLIIHKIEAVLQNKSMACGFHLEWEYSPTALKLVNIENMDWYQHWTLDGRFGDMTLGYHTIGKNLWMCYRDNDVNLVQTGMVRPQKTISSEVNLLFGNRIQHNNTNRNFLRMCKWMEDNNLNQYVDMTKPYNRAVGQPLLGKLVGINTLVDVSRILSLGRVGAVRLL
jgi:hypothetical protein